MDRLRCLIIDPKPVLRNGVRELLAARYDVEEASGGEAAVAIVADDEPFDVAIVDMRASTPDGGSLSGPATIRALLKVQPSIGIVAHGERPERQLATEAVNAGARAYVTKSSPLDELSRAVDAAAESETFIDSAVPKRGSRRALTKRQRQILQLMADGHSTARVARRLGVSGETVKTHTKNMLARLGARDRAHAVAIGLRTGLID